MTWHRSTSFVSLILALLFIVGCGDLTPEDGPQNTRVVTDDISSDTTWHADTRYIVEDKIDVDAQLEIEPGTIIEVDTGHAIQIDSGGALNAVGTADDEIVFTGTEQQPGWWDGIRFFTSEHPNNRLHHVVVEYAGNDLPANVVISDSNRSRDAAAEIQHSTMRHGEARGLFVYGGDAELRNAEGNEYHDNDIPVAIASTKAHQLDGDSSFSGNDNDYVEVGTGSSISDDIYWDALDVPYRMHSDTLDVRAVMEIEPGATLEFEADGELRIRGDDAGLVAEGTEDDNIVFTGTDETSGWWRGILFRNSEYPNNIISHSVVEYGGNGDHSANITVGKDGTSRSLRNADVTLEHSTIRHSSGYGVFISRGGSSLTEGDGNVFENNADDAIFDASAE